MAKVKSGGIRNLIGRVGGNVYYMNKGQNIARELAPAISNPQSAAQQEQRMRWANLVSFYRVNLPWMKRGAFESKKQTWSDYNAFVSANSKVSPVFLTKEIAEQGGAVVAPYIVTKGTLPSVNVNLIDSDQTFATDLYTGDNLTILPSTTAQELSRALLDNNNGLREGDQLSFIILFQEMRNSVPFIVARYYEFIIDSTDTRTLDNLGLGDLLVDDTFNEMNCLCFINNGAVCGGTCIVSRTTSGEIKVSSQAIALTGSCVTFLSGYTSETAFQQAAASYGESEANFLAAGYSGKASNISVPPALSMLLINGQAIGSTLRQSARYLRVTLSDTPAAGTSYSLVLVGRRYAGDLWSDYSQTLNATIEGNVVVADFTTTFSGYFTSVALRDESAGETLQTITFDAVSEDVTP